MSEAPRLAIVLPAYNEAERIGPALGELFTYLLADPARWHRHADESTALSTRPGQGLPHARLAVGGRSGQGHAMRLQGIHAWGGARPVRRPADPQHRVRRRAHLPRAQARLPDRD